MVEMLKVLIPNYVTVLAFYYMITPAWCPVHSRNSLLL